MPKSRGLAKNLARAQTMFALANLYQVRNHLLPLRPGAPCEVHPANRWVLHLPANHGPPIFALILVPFMRTNQYQYQ